MSGNQVYFKYLKVVWQPIDYIFRSDSLYVFYYYKVSKQLLSATHACTFIFIYTKQASE